MSDSEFCCRYIGRKRLVYEAAAESLRVASLCERDSHLTTFVKAEKLDLSAKPDPAPRVIQPRSPRYNLEVGKYIAHQEKRLFKLIDGIFGKPTVMKGRDCLATGSAFHDQWCGFNHPVAVGMDASRFDQHVSDIALSWEHSQWVKMVPRTERKRLKKLLSWQINNKGVAYAQGGRVKYSCRGRRMSGDMNTSSGNIMIMCALIYCYLLSQGLKTSDFWVANNGDDSVVVVEQHHLSKLDGIPKWFTEMGFTMKLEAPVQVLEQVEFCQTRPVYTARGWCMVRDPTRAMAKDLTANCDIKPSKHRGTWLGAVRDGGLALTDGVPVWPSFYQMFEGRGGDNQISEHLRNSGWHHLRGSLSFRDVAITAEARCSFYFAFGITPDEQEVLEAHFRSIKYRVEDSPGEVWNPAAEPCIPGGLHMTN